MDRIWEAKRELALRELGRRSMKGYVSYVAPYYDFGARQGDIYIHDQLMELLDCILFGELKNCMIFMPPGTGKSQLVSVYLPTCRLGLRPLDPVVCISYADDLASSFGVEAREVFTGDLHCNIFPEVQLAKIKSEGSNWRTEYKPELQRELNPLMEKPGGYYCAGVTGGLTGKRYELGIIDDPIKDRKQAESTTVRDSVYAYYKSVFRTRKKNADSQKLIMHTRWHEDDLAGRLIEASKEGGEKFYVHTVKAFHEKRGYIIRPFKGWTEDYWKQEQIDVGEYDWQALYQQRPFSEDGGVFKKEYFQYISLHELLNEKGEFYDYLDLYTFKDPAISEKQTADFTSIVTIAHDTRNNRIYVLDVFLGRVEADESINELFSIVKKYKPYLTGVENVAFQKMLIDEIKKQMKIRDQFFDLEAVKPMGEKVARMKATLRPRYVSKQIFHIKNARGITQLEQQLLAIPSGKHDDAPDALQGAVSLFDTMGKKVHYAPGQLEQHIMS